jgi:sec-independent protein translocase protein TatA
MEMMIHMPFNIGGTGFILIVLIALLLFGPSKLPQLGRAIGTTFREFRAGTREMIQQSEDDRDTPMDKGKSSQL